MDRKRTQAMINGQARLRDHGIPTHADGYYGLHLSRKAADEIRLEVADINDDDTFLGVRLYPDPSCPEDQFRVSGGGGFVLICSWRASGE